LAGKNQTLTLTVVVSGAPQTVEVKENQKVEHLMKEALKEAGIHGANLAEWTLRFAQGGGAIDPGSQIGAAGITDRATLFLDPDEGGGGEVAVTFGPPEPAEPPLLVDSAVSAAKLARQLADWRASEELYRARGIVLLGTGELHAEVGFLAELPVGPNSETAAMPLAVRIGFENYDLWAPSVRVIDPITRRWLIQPRLRAVDFSNTDAAGNALDVFVEGHPDTGRVFLCKRGVREYHSHPEHSGDDWLLHRDQGYGTLAQIAETLWRLGSRTVTGLNFIAQRIPLAGQGAAMTGTRVEIRQEDVDALSAEIEAQLPAQATPGQGDAQMIALTPGGAIPPGVLAQMPPELQAIFAGAQASA